MPIGVPHLRALVAVVDTGGFGAAASRLGISQSAVSHAIASLERITGRSVLTRDGAPRPTLLGEQILPHARTAVAAVSAVEQLAYRRNDHVAGELVLAAPPTVCHGLLPELLARWRVDFPDVLISLVEGEDEEVASWLDGAAAHLAVLVDPPVGRREGTILGTDRFYAVLRTDHPLAGQTQIDLADLADDEFLLSTGGCESHLRDLHRTAGIPFAPTHRVRQLSTVFAMVRAGVGVSVVPGLADGMQSTDVLMLPLTQQLHRTLVLTGPPHRPWHPVARVLVEAVTPARAA
jgi:DNA-binding transcriptional LysR family regulator